MHKEGAEHTEYENDLVTLINIDNRYGYLSATNKLLQPISFGHTSTSVREIFEKIFKMIFSLVISITIIRTPKMRDNRKTYLVSLPSHRHQCLYNFHKN